MNQEKEYTDEIMKRLKNPIWWLDHAILIALIIIVVYLGFKGHFIDTKIVEVCNGQPAAQTLLQNTFK